MNRSRLLLGTLAVFAAVILLLLFQQLQRSPALLVPAKADPSLAHHGATSSQAAQRIRSSGKQASPTPFEIHAAQNASAADAGTREAVVEPAASAPIYLGGKLIQRATGTGIPHVDVFFEAFESDLEIATVTTDETGQFHLPTPFKPGLVEVWAKHPNEETDPTLSVQLEEEFVWLLESNRGQTRELELFASRPSLSIIFVTLDAESREPVSATIELWLRQAGEDLPESHLQLETKADGRCVFGFRGDMHNQNLGLIAHNRSGLASNLLWAGVPKGPDPIEIPLTPAGELKLHFVDAEQAPIPNTQVTIGRTDIPFEWISARTDQAGHARLPGIPPGEYEVFVWYENEYFHLDSIEHTRDDFEATYTLDKAASIVIASGKVVDEDGNPLEDVEVHAWFEEAHTDENGYFEVRAELSELEDEERASIFVGPRGFNVDDYDPPDLAVPIGTKDLLFKRQHRLARRKVALEIVDAVSGSPLASAVFFAWHPPASPSGVSELEDHLAWANTFEWSATWNDGVQPELSWKPETQWRVRHMGHKPQSGHLENLIKTAEVDATASDVGPLRVRIELEPGFEFHVQVLDWEEESVPYARFFMDETPSAVADANGRAPLRSAHWPKSIRIEAEGFGSQNFAPQDWWEVRQDATIRLDHN